MHIMSLKKCQCYFFNNFVKRWLILVDNSIKKLYDFCISQGNAATVLKWGKQNYSHLRRVSFWYNSATVSGVGVTG